MKRLVSIIALTCAFVFTASAQTYNCPAPTYTQGPTFTYSQALSHTHGASNTSYGFFVRNCLIDDPANTEGDFFYGNVIVVRSGGKNRSYWYQWWADPNAGAKINVWQTNSYAEPLTIQYDPYCMMATQITSPSFP